MFGNHAFIPEEYEKSIATTLPYYEEYFKQIADIVTIVFRTPITWLDVGCGTGKMASIAVKNLMVKHMICCDSSSEMLGIAKERICSRSVEFKKIPVQRLQYDSKFDVITAILLNHYLRYEDRITSIKNCYNALKKNGLLFTVENFAPNSDVIKNLYLERWKIYQQNKGKNEKECENHINRYNTAYFPITIMEQIHLLQECGFVNVEIFWCSYMQVGILGIK